MLRPVSQAHGVPRESGAEGSVSQAHGVPRESSAEGSVSQAHGVPRESSAEGSVSQALLLSPLLCCIMPYKFVYIFRFIFLIA